ncbi:DUF494 family protein [candidate division GN15 bacterium]|jgi:Smg protein|nr:DUF494 family protein [candidate division GN15 bacterium]
MRDRILEIVVFLIDYMQEHREQVSDIDDISSILETMGYQDDEISAAYSWLMDRINPDAEEYFASFPVRHSSTRVLTASERALLSTEAQGFLFKLMNLGLIDDEQFEIVLDRLSVVSTASVTEEEIKTVASAVLFHDVEELDGLNLFDITSPLSPFVN